MDMNTIISTAAGGVVSALVSWLFYWLSGRDLTKEAKRLHDLNLILLRAFEEAGLAQVSRDASGRLVGLVLKGAVVEAASAMDSSDAEVIPASTKGEGYSVKIKISKSGEIFEADPTDLAGSHPVGRGGSVAAALGNFLVLHQERLGVEIQVDASAEHAEHERRTNAVMQR